MSVETKQGALVIMVKKLIFLGLVFLVFPTDASFAQLDRTFDRLFDEFLVTGFKLSPGEHGMHFIPASQQASRELTPALNSLIAGKISSFPLSSTITINYNFDSGVPVRDFGSLGPIFAESAKTLGRNRLYVGFNYTYLGLSRYRGLPTEDFRFTFTHQDVGAEGLGDRTGESDVVDLYLDLHLDANSYVVFATYGITDRFDIGIALPIVNVNLEGRARGVVQSFTFAIPNLEPQHQFGVDPLNPVFEKEIPYQETATGLGDLALRMKYHAVQSELLHLAILLDLRLPTGDERNFLGTGKPTTTILGILSKKIGGGTTHLNIGYQRRDAELDSDELEVVLGFDQEVFTDFTIAGEFIAEIDLDVDDAISLFPGSIEIVDQPGDGSQSIRHIDLSSIPERENDNTFDLALGVRIAATEQFSLLGSILVPLNHGGLKSTVTASVGMSVFF